jgi:hypothetical protein
MSKTILQGLVGAWCPSLGPSGYRLLDRTVRVNHGTFTNMDAGSDWLGSPGGWALDFDATNDFVDIGTRQYLSSGSPATVAWWERITSSGAGYYSRFRLATGARDMCVLRTDQGNYLGISTFNVSAGASKQFAGAPSVANSVGIWRHFALIMRAGPDATANADWSLVVDGVEYAATAAGAGTVVNANNRIGWDGVDNGANCQIAEFAIFNRAMTMPSLRQLYQLGRNGLSGLLTPQRRSYAFRVPAAGNRRRRIICGAEC